MITAHETPEIRNSALAAGAVRILRKPFDDDVLVTALKTAIERDSPVRPDAS